jgi:RNA polymerase sigma factor (sigma-70 family)
MEKIESYLMENLNEFVGFARKRLGNAELAADAVHESMLKALAGAEQIRDEEKAKAWFYRILRRTIIDLYRRRDARDRMLAGLEQELHSPPDSDEERVVCGCMVRLLPTLAPQYADLIQRMDLNEETPDVVAADLGISKNALNVRIHRARQQLKRHLEENCRICAKHGCLDCQCEVTGGHANLSTRCNRATASASAE